MIAFSTTVALRSIMKFVGMFILILWALVGFMELGVIDMFYFINLYKCLFKMCLYLEAKWYMM